MKYLEKLQKNFEHLINYSVSFILCFGVVILLILIVGIVTAPVILFGSIFTLMLLRVLFGIFKGK